MKHKSINRDVALDKLEQACMKISNKDTWLNIEEIAALFELDCLDIQKKIKIKTKGRPRFI